MTTTMPATTRNRQSIVHTNVQRNQTPFQYSSATFVETPGGTLQSMSCNPNK